MARRWAVTILGLAVGAAACGGGVGEVDSSAPRADSGSTSSSAAPSTTVPPTAAAATEAAPAPPAAAEDAGRQVVRYGGIELTVPAGWPVHDLDAAPGTCVRFDVNAVYLGSPSPDMDCPAQAIGRADAVLVEPGAPAGKGPRVGPSGSSVTANEVNGLSVTVDSSRAVEHELVVDVPQHAVTVTVSFGGADTEAQQIIASLKAAA